jgi:flagellar basal-body rod protein FlgF
MTGDLLELGKVMLAQSERRLEAVSRNIANVSTPGFKKETSFGDALNVGAASDAQLTTSSVDFAQGGLQLTANPLDLALSSDGFFKVRAGEEIFYSRGGHFHLTANGALASTHGMILQTPDGQDIVLSGQNPEILADGTILEGGLPMTKVGVVAWPDTSPKSLGGGLFAAPVEPSIAIAPTVRQGMIEASNVSMADEMVEMMSAIRQAEAGSRVVQVFDSLSGQMISTFGQGTR